LPGDHALRPTKPAFPYGGLPEYRTVDAVLRARRASARSLAVWQLLYAGCIGSQALVGIPVVHALRFDPELASVPRAQILMSRSGRASSRSSGDRATYATRPR
jgi:hypothetical protein